MNNYDGPGIYQHYKGGHYRVVGLSVHESTGAKLVIYHSYDVEHELERAAFGVGLVARPLNPEDGDDAWNTVVAPSPGVQVPRFRRAA